MHEQFDVKGGPMDGKVVALDKDHDEEVVLMQGKAKHVYRTVVRLPRDGVDVPARRTLWYIGPNPFN